MIRTTFAASGFLIALAAFTVDAELAIWHLFESFEPTTSLFLALGFLASIPSLIGALAGLVIGSVLVMAFGRARWLERLSNVSMAVSGIAFVVVGAVSCVLVAVAPDGLERRLEPSETTHPSSGSADRDGQRRHPNIVLIVADSFRQDVLEQPTAGLIAPNLLRLREQSISFAANQAVSSWTRPSMAGLLTGRFPAELGAHRSGLPQDAVTLAESLHAAGYETVGISDNYLTGPASGFSQGHEVYCQKNSKVLLLRLFVTDYLPSRLLSWLVVKLRLLYQGAPSVNSRVADWLDHRDRDRPFFLMLHYMDVHYPYYVYSEIPGNWSNRSTPETRVPYYKILSAVPSSNRSRGPFGELRMPAEQREDFWNRYLGSVQYFDHHLGELTEMLQGTADWDDTLVIFTADHGEEFFEHGWFSHGASLYQESVRVPLIIKLPKGKWGVGAGNDDPVSSLWIMPTIMEVAGVSSARSGQPPSLLRRPDSSSPVFSEFDRRGVKITSAQIGAHKLLRAAADDGRSKIELFDVSVDPLEQNNLWDASNDSPSELHIRLLEFEQILESMQAESDRSPTDADLEGLRVLGYVR